MKSTRSFGTLLLVIGILLSAFGINPAIFALAGVTQSCPPTVSFTLQNGQTVTGTLLSGSSAASAWNVGNPAGVSATYTSSQTYTQITNGGGYASGSPVGYFQTTNGSPTYLYLGSYFYQPDGSCSNAVAGSSATQATSTVTTGSNTYVCTNGTCVTSTSSTVSSTMMTTSSITLPTGATSTSTTSSAASTSATITSPPSQAANIQLLGAGVVLGILGLVMVRRKKA